MAEAQTPRPPRKQVKGGKVSEGPTSDLKPPKGGSTPKATRGKK